MTLHGNIKFKDAIIVDEKLLRELEEIILNFYDEISYSCLLCNDDKITFDSLDELLNYENVKTRKIERLSISFGYFNEIEFKTEMAMFSSYKSTVQGTFITEKYDESVLFTEKIKNALTKNRQSRWYTLMTKFSYFHFTMFLLAFTVGLCIYILFVSKTKINQATSYVPMYFCFGIAFSVLLLLISFLLSRIRNALLPPIAYKIGEQIKEIDRGRDLFGKIFWGIIVTFVISLLVGFIFK